MVEVRQVRENDEKGVRELFCSCFGRRLSHSEWIWKYRGSPWGSSAVVAVDGNSIVAHYGGLRMKFLFQGKILNAFQFCDVMTHPGYRGRFVSKTPIIIKLGERFYGENQMDFAFGFPSLRHARLQSIRLGGEGYRLVSLYKKGPLKRRFVMWTLKVREGWEYFHAGEFSEFSQFLINKNNSILQLAKDEKYVKWRYMENPLRKYRLLVLKRLNNTKGYVIFTLHDGWCDMLDIFYKNEREIKDILNSVEKYASSSLDNIKGIRAWFHPNEHLICLMKDLGFRSEDHIPVAFKSVNTNCGVTSDIFYNYYFYRMGDYDGS